MPEEHASLSKELDQVGRRLRQRRRAHPARARLPDEMWTAAVEVAGERGICATARTLRLDYANLKRRVETAPSRVIAPTRAIPTARATVRTMPTRRKTTAREAAPTDFVELLAGSIAADRVIELEGQGGMMRIQMKAENAGDDENSAGLAE